MKNAPTPTQNENGYADCTYYGEIKGNLLRAKRKYGYQYSKGFDASGRSVSVYACKVVDNPEDASYWGKTSDGKIWLIKAGERADCIANVQTVLNTVTGLRAYVTWKGKNWKAWQKKWGGNSYTGGM